MIGLTEAEIARRLKEAHRQTGGETYLEYMAPDGFLQEPPRLAAVLIPLLKKRKHWHLLFIRRTADLHEHSNQVAFPGGRTDPQDASPEQTALREANEEIGLNPADVRILGQLRDFMTITNYCVTPVIGAIPWPYPLQQDPKEVRRIFTIPLDWLADPQNRQERQRALPPPFASVPVIYYHPYDGEVLWGASARFTLVLLDILKS